MIEPADCQHRAKRLVIDFQSNRHERIHIMCRDCLTTTEAQPTGLQAWIAWLRDRRLERQLA